MPSADFCAAIGRLAASSVRNNGADHIRDKRLRELGDKIIEAQVREIAEMKALIADLERNPPPQGAPDLLSYRERGAPAPRQSSRFGGICFPNGRTKSHPSENARVAAKFCVVAEGVELESNILSQCFGRCPHLSVVAATYELRSSFKSFIRFRFALWRLMDSARNTA